MKPFDFDYRRVTSIDEALELLKQYGGDAKVLAGGQSLVPSLNMRLSSPRILIDINGIKELEGITVERKCVRVGALVRHAEIYSSPEIAEHVPLLSKAIRHVAHAAIRNRGTHGGSIAYADPAAETPACTVALNANLVLRGSAGERKVAARDFFLDLYETEKRDDEILVAGEYPRVKGEQVTAFYEFARRKGDFATTGLAVTGEIHWSKLRRVSLVFFSVGNTPILVPETAAKLTKSKLSPDDIDRAVQDLEGELEVIGDLYSSPEMKMQLAKHFLRQALTEIGSAL